MISKNKRAIKLVGGASIRYKKTRGASSDASIRYQIERLKIDRASIRYQNRGASKLTRRIYRYIKIEAHQNGAHL
jgi:hypothetical protein